VQKQDLGGGADVVGPPRLQTERSSLPAGRIGLRPRSDRRFGDPPRWCWRHKIASCRNRTSHELHVAFLYEMPQTATMRAPSRRTGAIVAGQNCSSRRAGAKALWTIETGPECPDAGIREIQPRSPGDDKRASVETMEKGIRRADSQR